MSYAADTTVSVEKSRAELEALLVKAGARQRGVASDDDAGTVQIRFTIGTPTRQVRLALPLPKFAAFASVRKRNGKSHAESQRLAWEQACRSRWRAAVLLLKAKLEAIELGVSTFEREFLADLWLPDGRTVHEALEAPIADAYRTGAMPPLLGPGPSSGAS